MGDNDAHELQPIRADHSATRDADAHRDADGDSGADADSDSDARARANCDASSDAIRATDCDAASDAVRYADGATNCDAIRNADAIRDADARANRDINPATVRDIHAATDAVRDANPVALANRDANPAADCQRRNHRADAGGGIGGVRPTVADIHRAARAGHCRRRGRRRFAGRHPLHSHRAGIGGGTGGRGRMADDNSEEPLDAHRRYRFHFHQKLRVHKPADEHRAGRGARLSEESQPRFGVCGVVVRVH